MNQDLKVRMLDAAAVADKLWQRNVAKALTDGIAEIERLQTVLFELDRVTRPIVKKMEQVLPLLRRLDSPTEEMFAAMSLGDTPFICRRKADKSAHEVVYQSNEDWRDAVGTDADQKVVFEGPADDAYARYHREVFIWRYNVMMHVAAGQPA